MSGKSSLSTDISPQNNSAKNVEGILDFNALQYECYPDMSVCVNRTYKESHFQKASHGPGDCAYVILNSGSDYINARTSYLTFDLALGIAKDSPTLNASWGLNSSATNLIKTIRITDRAGNEIEYITQVNKLAAINRRMKRSAGHFNTVGSLSHPNTGVVFTAATSASVDVTTAAQRFIIPLRDLCGLFDYDQLLPPQLCSGLRIQITFEDTAKAFKFDRELIAGDTYTIVKPRIVLDSHKVTDSVARQLNMRSANDGLEIQFRTWFTAKFISSGSSLNLEARRAVSRAFCALVHMQKVEAKEDQRDSMSTTALDLVNYQFRAGNLYFPQQPTKGPNAALVAPEALFQTLQLCGKTETPLDNSFMNIDDYLKAEDAGAVSPAFEKKHGGMAIVACNLERSSVQDVSGLPLNNSRVLAFNATRAGSVGDVETTMYLQYLKIARVFMDNTELEE